MSKWDLDREDKETILFILGLLLTVTATVAPGADDWPVWLTGLIPVLLVGSIVSKAKP